MKKTFILLNIAVLIAGFTGIFGKLITLNEGLLVWYRFTLSSILLFIILKLSNKFIKIPFNKAYKIIFAGILLSLHWLFFYGSIKYANVSVGVICFAMSSFFTAILAPLITKKKFSIMEFILGGIVILGIGLIFQFDTKYRIGIIMGMISSFFYSLFSIVNEKVCKDYPSENITFYEFIGGTMCITAIMPFYLNLFPVESVIPSLRDSLYMIVFCLFFTILLMMLIAQVQKEISAFTVNLYFNLEPIYSIIIAVILFKEHKEFNLVFYIGLSLIIISVLLQTMRIISEKKKKKKLI